MKVWDSKEIMGVIAERLPEGRVIPRHKAGGHFYEIREGDLVLEEVVKEHQIEEDGEIVFIEMSNIVGPVYPSVTGKLQILKDEGLINYKMNRAIESLSNFMFSLTGTPTMEAIDEAAAKAARVSQDILEDAGDIGTRIHNIREAIFSHWMNTGSRPENFLSFIPEAEVDTRVTSAVRALQKFCIERDYIPVACELLVYSHKLKVAGTLDDLGLVRKVLNKGKAGCDHAMLNMFGEMVPEAAMIVDERSGKKTCIQCGYQLSEHRFALMDLKTSNQFKDHYFFQVALYSWMFSQLTGLKPQEHFILKVSKEDGSYKIEDLKRPAKLAEYARSMIKTNEGVEFIKSLRKDNQRNVVALI